MSIKEIARGSVVPVTSAIVGGIVVIAGIKLSPSLRSTIESDVNHRHQNEQIDDDIFQKQEGIRQQFDDLFHDDFIAQNDPFEQMKKMRKQMEKRMEGFDSRNSNDISKREDDNFVYYDIKVDDVNSTSINTKVEQGYVTISATVEKKSESDGKSDRFSAQSIFRSSFNRTFPLPENVDQNKMQMLTEKDKVILKFPKYKV